MDIPFIKMHSSGNDYILLDCTRLQKRREELFSYSFISPASARRFGVGSDGVIAVMSSDYADAEIRTFLSDGREEILNINALMCTSKFLYEGINSSKDLITVQTKAGVKKITPFGNGKIMSSCEVEAGKADFVPFGISRLKKEGKIRFDNCLLDFYCVSLGDLYGAVFCEDVSCASAKKIDTAISRKISVSSSVDTVLVQDTGTGNIKMRFIKSGCGEILSCAAGACCGVAACVKKKICKKDVYIPVESTGGVFHIRCDGEYNLSVIGECEKVYDGIYEWNI